MYGSGPEYNRLQTEEDSRPIGRFKNFYDKYRDRMMIFGTATAIVCLVAGVAILAVKVSASGQDIGYSHEKDPTYWHNVAQSELEGALKQRNTGVAKNVILFLGDGMGPTTVTAGRILAGQIQGHRGEEVPLSFDLFPYTGLSRTYNTDRQVTDSAASGTAYLTGVKTNQGILGLDAKALRGNCASSESAEVDSILRWSKQAGKSTGVVTTTRITHATPAASYSHCPERNWESDAMVYATEKGCKDIAAQLVDDNIDIDVILGGGRATFYPNGFDDPHGDNKTHYLRRLDGRNLVEEWKNAHKENGHKFEFVSDRTGLEATSISETDYLLGLFNEDHLEYEKLRDRTKEPSLAEMTAKAIDILKRNAEGFFLLVEGGRIDHGHHASQASLALHEVVAFAEAVERATKLTSEADTLIVVTADHSHTMAISGYPSRGNDILGLVDEGGMIRFADDLMPFTTVLYANGPGHVESRENLTYVDTTNTSYVTQSAVPLLFETHGGEDVAIYAKGPQSFLYSGVHEQNYIPIVMAYASCVGPYSDSEQRKCAKDVQTGEKTQPASDSNGCKDHGTTLSFIIAFICFTVQAFVH